MPNKKKKRRLRPWALLTLVFGGLALLALLVSTIAGSLSKPIEDAALTQKVIQESEEEKTVLEQGMIPPAEDESREDLDVFHDTDSLLLLANKKHPLPDGYAPYDLVEPSVPMVFGSAPLRAEAAAAIEEMFAAAANDGVTLLLGSGYRSQEYQDQLYSGYSAQYGWEVADTISSRPGYSDHQTGLAADISDHDGATYLSEEMENTPEGVWLKDHAHEYGFIMRYPKGKQEITGYAYEPWHFRYVGVDYATAIYNIDPFYSFEEYFGVEGGDYE